MAKATITDALRDSLEKDPAIFLEALKQRLVEARMMTWQIIATKKFTSFDDAHNLVDAYDHLNKIISIFQKYQPALPLKERETDKKRDKRQGVLVTKEG